MQSRRAKLSSARLYSNAPGQALTTGNFYVSQDNHWGPGSHQKSIRHFNWEWGGRGRAESVFAQHSKNGRVQRKCCNPRQAAFNFLDLIPDHGCRLEPGEWFAERKRAWNFRRCGNAAKIRCMLSVAFENAEFKREETLMMIARGKQKHSDIYDSRKRAERKREGIQWKLP